jgi:hypothetical protein
VFLHLAGGETVGNRHRYGAAREDREHLPHARKEEGVVLRLRAHLLRCKKWIDSMKRARSRATKRAAAMPPPGESADLAKQRRAQDAESLLSAAGEEDPGAALDLPEMGDAVRGEARRRQKRGD